MKTHLIILTLAVISFLLSPLALFGDERLNLYDRNKRALNMQRGRSSPSYNYGSGNYYNRSVTPYRSTGNPNADFYYRQRGQLQNSANSPYVYPR